MRMPKVTKEALTAAQLHTAHLAAGLSSFARKLSSLNCALAKCSAGGDFRQHQREDKNPPWQVDKSLSRPASPGF